MIVAVLNPNVKMAYVEARWHPSWVEVGVRKLESVVCLTFEWYRDTDITFSSTSTIKSM
jgi:hypothetical protein